MARGVNGVAFPSPYAPAHGRPSGRTAGVAWLTKVRPPSERYVSKEVPKAAPIREFVPETERRLPPESGTAVKPNSVKYATANATVLGSGAYRAATSEGERNW